MEATRGVDTDVDCDDCSSLVVGPENPENVVGVDGAAVGPGELSFATRPMMMPIAPRTTAADTAMTVGTSQRGRWLGFAG